MGTKLCNLPLHLGGLCFRERGARALEERLGQKAHQTTPGKVADPVTDIEAGHGAAAPQEAAHV